MCGEHMARFALKLNQAYYVRESLIKLLLAVVKKVCFLLGLSLQVAHTFPFQQKVIRIMHRLWKFPRGSGSI